MPEINRMPPAQCPNCGAFQTAATGIGGSRGAEPGPGDITICLDCAALLCFTDELTFRPFTQAEADELAPETLATIGAAQTAIRDRRLDKLRRAHKLFGHRGH